MLLLLRGLGGRLFPDVLDCPSLRTSIESIGRAGPGRARADLQPSLIRLTGRCSSRTLLPALFSDNETTDVMQTWQTA